MYFYFILPILICVREPKLKAAMSYREMRCDDARIVHFDVWGRFSGIVHVDVGVGLVRVIVSGDLAKTHGT